MNDDRIIEVLTRIEEEKDLFAMGAEGALGFNMQTWYSVESNSEDASETLCGTVACLAGHTVNMAGYSLVNGSDMCMDPNGGYHDMEAVAAVHLGIEPENGNPFYLQDLDAVYEWAAHQMGVDEQVLRDKVEAGRTR
jgi:hypothetical protein